MSIKPWQLSRRTLLRGVGAGMSLPFLDAMVPSASAAGKSETPVRMAVLYWPNGVNPHHWSPKGTGRDYEISEILKPLEAHREEMLVLSGLANKRSQTGDGHYVKTAGFLTGETINKTTGRDLNSRGVSMDQLAARKLAGSARFPSLELGIDPIASGIDRNVGYTQLYGSHISWRSPTTPLPCELNPVRLFDRLFRVDNGKNAAAVANRSSILDLIRRDAQRMMKRVGADDRQKLDEYLTAVRDVEQRVEREARLRAAEMQLDPAAREQIAELSAKVDGFQKKHPTDQAFQVLRAGDHTEYVRLMLDILVLALWTDSTRVATFMFGRSVSGKNFSFLDGVEGGFHELSHHENKAEKLEQYKRINIWHSQQFAYFLDRMRAIKEGEGTLLDNSMVLFGSSLRNGNAHEPKNLPLVLAGRAGGKIKPGRHIQHADGTPLCNLYVTMLNHLGAPVDAFADSNGMLELS